jgi:hypothetical protein
MLFVAPERRREHDDHVEIALCQHLVPVARPDILGDAGFERPGFACRKVGYILGAGEDVVGFPMVLVPEGERSRADQTVTRAPSEK